MEIQVFFKSHLKNHVIDNISNSILETNHGILKLNYGHASAQVANDFYIMLIQLLFKFQILGVDILSATIFLKNVNIFQINTHLPDLI